MDALKFIPGFKVFPRNGDNVCPVFWNAGLKVYTVMYILPFPVWECGIAPVLGRNLRMILLDTLTTIPT